MGDKFFQLIQFDPKQRSKRQASIPKARKARPDITSKELRLCSTPEARGLLPYSLARQFKVLPLALIPIFGRKVLHCAVLDEDDREVIRALQFATGVEIRLFEVPQTPLLNAIFSAYHSEDQLLSQAVEELKCAQPSNAVSAYRDLPLDFVPENAVPAKLLGRLLQYALGIGASDLHLLPKQDGLHIKLRVNGDFMFHPKPVCDLSQYREIVKRAKVLASLDTNQQARPLDGSLQVPGVDGDSATVRLSCMPTLHGEKLVFRFFGQTAPLTLDQLGLSETARNFLEAAITKSEGSLIFAGPTGSGKSTSMYAVIQRLLESNLNVLTIEDPVEVPLEGVAQTSLDRLNAVDYADCLKSALRQDPDVILLGEMRDPETAQIAMQAALTGHLLLSTLHVRNVFDIPLRLAHFGVDALTVASASSLYVCQRLVPQLCEACKVIDLESSRQFGAEVSRSIGCSKCDYSGYAGRIAVAEMLHITPEIRASIIEGGGLKHNLSCVTDLNYIAIEGALEKLLRSGRISKEQYINFK